MSITKSISYRINVVVLSIVGTCNGQETPNRTYLAFVNNVLPLLNSQSRSLTVRFRPSFQPEVVIRIVPQDAENVRIDVARADQNIHYALLSGKERAVRILKHSFRQPIRYLPRLSFDIEGIVRLISDHVIQSTKADRELRERGEVGVTLDGTVYEVLVVCGGIELRLEAIDSEVAESPTGTTDLIRYLNEVRITSMRHTAK